MKSQQPIASEQEHRVLKFRPRTLAHPPGRLGNLGDQSLQDQAPQQPDQSLQDQAPQQPNDLSRYERDRDEPDDFRRRMLANVAALAFTVALTAIGIWLAVSIADLRKTQDCVLMGRRDCARISTTHF